MDEKDKEIAQRQLTSFDRRCGQDDRNIAVVVLPPKRAGGQERWVGVNPVTGEFKRNVEQPDPDRKVVYGGEGHCRGCLCYWYADELPYCMRFFIVMAVVLSILVSPLTLLCLVPMILRLKKVK